jgi:hypothetical protein
MKKALIWNAALIVLGIFIVLLLEADPNFGGIIPGWSASYLNLWMQFGVGCILGLFFILMRYLSLGIMSIANTDLRLVAMLFTYTLPLCVALMFVQSIGDEQLTHFAESRIPLGSMQQKLGYLRKAGFFKNQANVPEKDVLAMVLGKGVLEQQLNGQELVFYDAEQKIDVAQLLKCDDNKTLLTPVELQQVGTYADFVNKLSGISEGHFKPEDVLETLDSNQKRSLSFRFKKQSKQIVLVQDEWENFKKILLEANASIPAADYQFYHLKDANLIVGLSAEEKVQFTKSLKLELE